MPSSRQNRHSAPAEAYAPFHDLNECLQKSQEETVFILKHSSTCPVSAHAKREVDAFLREHPARVYLVVVQTERPASNAIAERLRIKHESPQVLCLRNGAVQAVYNHTRSRWTPWRKRCKWRDKGNKGNTIDPGITDCPDISLRQIHGIFRHQADVFNP